VTALLLKFAPWVAGAIVLLGLGGWAGYHLNPWQARYQALQTSDALARTQAEETVRKTLLAQLAQAQETTRNNQAAMVTLANQNAQNAADRDATIVRLHRLEQLLAAEAARTAANGGMPKTGSRPATVTSPGDPGIDRAGELLVAARDECRRNANRLQALIAEITPQL